MAQLPPALSQTGNNTDNSCSGESSSIKNVLSSFSLRSISEKNVIDFTRGFAVMLKARLSLIQALDTSIGQEENARFKEVLMDIRKNVRGGESLATSLSKHPDVFDTFYVNLVKVGELAGILGDVLLRLADYMLKRHTLKKKVKMAMLYPAMILGVAVSAILFLLLIIIPTFAEMYRDFDAELPELTQLVLSASQWLSNYFWLLLLVLIGMILTIKYVLQRPKFRYKFDRIKLKVPFLGTLFTENIVARFCQTLGTLLKSGISLVEALSIIQKATKNLLVQDAIKGMLVTIKKGESLGEAMRKKNVFPPIVLQMISVGEETAELDRMLLHVADHFREEIDLKVENLTSIIEPTLIIILGIVLGFLIVAMYLPMFELMNVIG